MVEANRCVECPDLEPFPTGMALALHLERHRKQGGLAAAEFVPPAPAPDLPGLGGSEFEEGELPRSNRPPEPGRPQFSKIFECPECHKPFGTPETMSHHVERHREVMAPVTRNGVIVSMACPKGCTRHFSNHKNSEYRAHVPMCNGSKPLGPRVGPQVEVPLRRARRSFKASKREPLRVRALLKPPAPTSRTLLKTFERTPPDVLAEERKERNGVMKENCTICGKPVSSGAGKSAHMRSAHKKPGASAAAAPARVGSGDPVDQALEKLRLKRVEILAGIPELKKLDAAISALEGLLSDPT